MPFHPDQLRQHLSARPAPSGWWVALSGGLDSTVLLHALVQAMPAARVRAVHVNHQLSPYAGQWAAQCQALCDRLGVPLQQAQVVVTPAGKGLEDAARQARYQVLSQCLEPGEYLLTAHHAVDQAETLLLRLLRGAGVRGLSAMAELRPLGQGSLWRPLLAVSRADLYAYAWEQGLQWVEDESNQDLRYDRNYLRHQVLPQLAQRWPDFARRWQQTARHLAQAQSLLDDLAVEDLTRAEPRAERLGHSLDLIYLQCLSEARRHNLLRFWLHQQGAAVPEQVHLNAVEQQLIQGREDAEAQVRWGHWVVRRFRQRLYCLPAAALAPVADLHLACAAGSCDLPDGGRFTLLAASEQSATERLRADLTDLHLRWRQGGERCRPARRAHSQTLKKLLQEAALEPWLRERLPLLYSGDTLVAVADLWVCADYCAAAGQPGFRLHWQPGTGIAPQGQVFD